MTENALRALDAAAFNSFDGGSNNFEEDDFDPNNFEEDDYDPDNYDEYGKRKRKAGGGGRKRTAMGIKRSPMQMAGATKTQPSAQFDITIASTFASQTIVELFNAQFSITKIVNGTTNAGFEPLMAARAYTDIAGDTFIGHSITYTNQANNKVIYWDTAGNLIYKDFTPVTGGTITISCKQIPYRCLFDFTEHGAFLIKQMRMKFTTAGQINNDFTVTEKTWLGKRSDNSISISTFLRPDQFQSLIVDMPIPVAINSERGIQYPVNGNETILINMFISEYTKSVI